MKEQTRGLFWAILTVLLFHPTFDALCAQLLVDGFRTEEESTKAIDPEKYRAEMHDAVKDLP